MIVMKYSRRSNVRFPFFIYISRISKYEFLSQFIFAVQNDLDLCFIIVVCVAICFFVLYI